MEGIRTRVDSFINFLRSSKKTMLLIAAVSLISILSTSGIAVYLSTYHNYTIPSFGTIKTIGVEAYWDQELENETTTINWGVIWLGASTNATLYIRSVSSTEIILQLYPSNITPHGISEYIDLSWNYNGTSLSPNDVIEVTLVLSTSGDYSFVDYLVTNKVKGFNMEIHIVPVE